MSTTTADVVAPLQHAGLEPRDVESLREHYTLTLRRWLPNLDEHRTAAVADIGEERARIWRLCMTAAALGFEDGDLSVYQVLVARTGAPHGLPLRRALTRDAAEPDVARRGVDGLALPRGGAVAKAVVRRAEV